MMLAALAAVCLNGVQAPTITFETRAARLPQVLADLSVKANLKLESTPFLSNDVLAISAKDVPLDVLMAKIAGVTSAEWKQDGEITRLVQSQSAMNREIQEERTRRLEALRKGIAERVKALTAKPAKPKSDDDEEVAVTEMAQSVPEKTITKLLQGIDLSAIAMLGGNERVVYSTNPTRMQKPLPGTAAQAINALVVHHNSTVSNVPQVPSEEEEKMLANMPEFMKGMLDRHRKKIENPSKALLVASRTDMGMFAATSLELRIYDAEGKVAYSQSSMLNSPSWAAMMTTMGTAPKPAKDGKQVEVTYSADAKALMESTQGFATGGMNVKLDPKIRAKLAQPDKIDPLSYMATDELFSIAKAKGKALVAHVPDAMMSSMQMFAPGAKQTVDEVVAELSSSEDSNYSETEGWIVVKPAQPTKSRSNRTDRVALANLIRITEAKGVPDLDDVAAYSLTSPSPMENGIGQMYAMLMIPGMFNYGLGGFTDWNAYRLYGSMPATQRQNLIAGGAVPVSGMTPVQQGLWRTMVFGAMNSIRFGEKKSVAGFDMGMMMGMMGSMHNDFKQEPTELMPNGLPGDATMSMATSQQPFANPVGENGASMSGYMGVLGLDELALFKMFKEDPNMAAMSGFMPSIDRMRIGQRTIYTMRLDLPQQAYAEQSLQSNKIDKSAPIVAMNNLPPEFQKQLAARLEEIKKSPLGMMSGMMGGMRGTIKP